METPCTEIAIRINPETTFVSYLDKDDHKSYKHHYPDWQETGELRFIVNPEMNNETTILNELSCIRFSAIDSAIQFEDEQVWNRIVHLIPDVIQGTSKFTLLDKYRSDYSLIHRCIKFNQKGEFGFHYRRSGMEIDMTVRRLHGYHDSAAEFEREYQMSYTSETLPLENTDTKE